MMLKEQIFTLKKRAHDGDATATAQWLLMTVLEKGKTIMGKENLSARKNEHERRGRNHPQLPEKQAYHGGGRKRVDSFWYKKKGRKSLPERYKKPPIVTRKTSLPPQPTSGNRCFSVGRTLVLSSVVRKEKKNKTLYEMSLFNMNKE